MKSIPFSGGDKHPVMISTSRNEAMKAWDCALYAGNFKSESDARKYAKRIKEFLEQEMDGTFESVQ